MKKIIAVGILATVAACNQAEPAPEAAATEAATPAEPMAADGGTPYGNFKVTLEDGSVLNEEVRADGTYTSTSASGEQRTGTWVQKGDQYCTTSSDEGAVERCHKESINADGAWVSVDPDGASATIERVEAAE